MKNNNNYLLTPGTNTPEIREPFFSDLSQLLNMTYWLAPRCPKNIHSDVNGRDWPCYWTELSLCPCTLLSLSTSTVPEARDSLARRVAVTCLPWPSAFAFSFPGPSKHWREETVTVWPLFPKDCSARRSHWGESKQVKHLFGAGFLTWEVALYLNSKANVILAF